MTVKWLPGAKVLDLQAKGAGYGPFAAGQFRGFCLHVNVGSTTDAMFAAFGTPANPNSVVPTGQIYKQATKAVPGAPAGNFGTHQYLPFDCQPWCQAAGNQQYGAWETEGFPDQPLTDFQLNELARVAKVYHDEMGMPYSIADTPGVRGIITHSAGGAAWGGHACPGTIRAGQRSTILQRAEEIDMTTPADVWAYQIHLTNDQSTPLTPVNDFLQSTLERVKDLQADTTKLQANDTAQTVAINALKTQMDALKGQQTNDTAMILAKLNTITAATPQPASGHYEYTPEA